jgi:hypothetical protein
MSTMLKSVIAGATALALAGGSLAYAQHRPDPGPGAHHARMSAEDVVAFGDARIAALQAGLKLTADQEKNWPALEKALKDAAKQRSERFAARASTDKPRDPIERLRARAESMSERGATLKTVADAAAPLYQSLDDAQKKRFVMLAHFEGRRFAHDMRRHHHHRGMHRGMMGGDERGPGGPPAPDAPRPQ